MLNSSEVIPRKVEVWIRYGGGGLADGLRGWRP